MVVAVHTDPMPSSSVYLYFVYKIVAELSLHSKDNHIHLLVNSSWKDDIVREGISVTQIPAFGSFLHQYKLTNFINKTLSSIKADAFLSLTGYSSNAVKISNHVFLGDDFFLQEDPKAKKKQLKEIENVKTIFVFSNNEKKYLQGLNDHLAGKTAVVYGAAKEMYHSTAAEEQLAAKARYTDGTEYLLYDGSLFPQHMVQLLKAFSLFKKRQKTSMKIVLATNGNAHRQELIKLLGSYKYRADVVLQTDISELEIIQLFGAAYGYINPFNERTLIPSLSAMQAQCPVITSSDSAITEFSIDAALYYTKNDTADLAEKMMLLYRDEDLRSSLIKKGSELATNLSWQQTVDTIMKQIEVYNS